MRSKKILSFAIRLLLTSTASGCSKPNQILVPPTAPTWKTVASIKTAFSNNNAYFIDDMTGIVVGTAGEIHYTGDGGKNWGVGKNSSLFLTDVNMLNDKVGWACGEGSNVIKTVDGGATWQQLAAFGVGGSNHLSYLDFIDEKTGWIAAPYDFDVVGKSTLLCSTTDGGSTWNRINLPADIKGVAAIELLSSDKGYVLDQQGNMFITANGGKSFTRQEMGIKDISIEPNAASDVTFRFIDERNGVIFYHDQSRKLVEARTSDGGKNWIKEKLPDISGGAVNLSRDGMTLTLTFGDGVVKVLRYE